MRLTRRDVWLAYAGLLTGAGRAALAHPLPNTVITVSETVSDMMGGLRLAIAMPAAELRLALPGSLPTDMEELAGHHQDALRRYFDAHLAVLSREGVRQPLRVSSITLRPTFNDHVGTYQELRLVVDMPATAAFNPRDFVLRYDAIMHQIPNHTATVYWAQASGTTEAGVIAYDPFKKRTPAFYLQQQ